MAVTEIREVEKTSWVGRLGNSFKGVLVGIVLFIAGFPVLYCNESRSVATERRLDEGASAVVSVAADKVDGANEGKLVHVSGLATTEETLVDPQFGVSAKAIKLAREVEVYQWIEDSDTHRVKRDGKEYEETTYTYKLDWCSKPVDSQGFKEKGHDNFPAVLPYENRETLATKVTLGAFTLSSEDIKRIGGETPIEFPADYKLPEALVGAQFMNGTIYIPAAEAAPAPVAAVASAVANAVAAGTTNAVDGAAANAVADATNAVATAAAAAVAPAPKRDVAQMPKVGDIRVSFRAVTPHDISIVERQTGSTFAPWTASDGKDISMLVSGLRTAEQMFARAKSANATFTWIMRLVGFFMMFVGVKMVLGPLVTLVDVIPILNGIVSMGVSLVAFLVAAVFALLTVAVSWIVVRPVLGIALLVAAGALAGYLFMKKKQAAIAK